MKAICTRVENAAHGAPQYFVTIGGATCHWRVDGASWIANLQPATGNAIARMAEWLDYPSRFEVTLPPVDQLAQAITAKICPCCQRGFTAEQWAALAFVGNQVTEDETGKKFTLELRNCGCGSTIGLEKAEG